VEPSSEGGNTPPATLPESALPESTLPESALARRLNQLFDTAVKSYDKRGRPVRYSTPEVARAITDDPSHTVSISRVTLWKVREGRANPTMEKVRAIAKFFDDHRPDGTPRVTAAWLLAEGDEAIGPDLDDPPERAEQVRRIAMRAGRMSPDRLRTLLEMIEAIDPEPGEAK
jgi:transcriptional regulator with XRE-family HTH domain